MKFLAVRIKEFVVSREKAALDGKIEKWNSELQMIRGEELRLDNSNGLNTVK